MACVNNFDDEDLTRQEQECLEKYSSNYKTSQQGGLRMAQQKGSLRFGFPVKLHQSKFIVPDALLKKAAEETDNQ